MAARRGKFNEKISSILLGKRMPRYFMCDVVHLKGKSTQSSVDKEVGIDMFSASDF